MVKTYIVTLLFSEGYNNLYFYKLSKNEKDNLINEIMQQIENNKRYILIKETDKYCDEVFLTNLLIKITIEEDE